MKNLRRNSFILSVISTAIVLVCFWLGFWVNMENRSLDFRFQTRGTQISKAPIVIAKIIDQKLD